MKDQLKTGTEFYTDVLTKFNDRFEQNCSPSFSNLLWQLIVNDAWAGRNAHCFVPVTSSIEGGGVEIGIAEQGEQGYSPTRVHFSKGTTMDQAFEVCNDINEALFGLLPRATADIMLQSMRYVAAK